MIRLPQQTNAAAWCNNLIHRQHVDDARWSSSHRYQSQILVENGDFLYQLGSTNYNIVTKFGIETLEWYGYQSEKIMNIRLLVLTQYTNVTDRWTNRHRMTA